MALKTIAAGVMQDSRGAQFLVLGLVLFAQVGCQSPSEYRLEADEVAEESVREKMQAFISQSRREEVKATI